MGRPTQFIRFGGCNLRCPGWACDTQHAIDPGFRKEWKQMTPQEVVNSIAEWPNNITLTGGEPFLQNDAEMVELVELVDQLPRYVDIDVFTNGTIAFPKEVIGKVKMILDWKLPGSGEVTFDSIRLKNIRSMGSNDSIKFTIAHYEDYKMAKSLWCNMPIGPHQVFAGVVWGKLKEAELASWMLEDELPWQLNVQVHNHIWNRDQRGI